MRVSSQDNRNFKAQLISQWRCSSAKNKAKNISIVAIEKRDLPFIEKFVDYIDKFNEENLVKKEIMRYSSKTILELLKSDISGFDKVKMFIATHDRIPCGIFVANVPKVYANGEAFVYSSRHNSGKNETEMDWFVTWSPKHNEKIKGIGKALVGEYFRTVKKDKFRDVFVRSEVPEKSYASSFYEGLGFERIGTKRLKLFNKNSAQYVIDDFSENNDETIPMIITRSRLQKTAEELSTKMTRQEFKKNSSEAEELIEI